MYTVCVCVDHLSSLANAVTIRLWLTQRPQKRELLTQAEVGTDSPDCLLEEMKRER